MIKNYFEIAWRNLKRNKLYSFINIGGLSVGIAICMLIMLYVAHEMSFDRFHKNADRIFYLAMNSKFDNKEISIDRMSYESGPMIKNADPGIESYLKMKEINDNRVIENITSPEKKFTEKNILLADSNFFNFFSFRLIQGDPKNVLKKPFSIVISVRTAQKYFGNADPVGKLLKYDPPSNSSIDYDFIGSMSSIRGMGEAAVSEGKFEVGSFKTFLLLSNTNKAGAIGKTARQLGGVTAGKFNKFNFTLNAFINRHRDYDNPANAKYWKIFSWVAALILFLALINYMSLATALSTIRSKEIGVRKVLGAGRDKIVKQFYLESGLYTVIAFLLGVLLFSILRPGFYDLLQLKIDNTFLKSSYIIIIFAGLFIITILISGSYPSLVLSSFDPVKVLYGRLSRQRGGAIIRRFFSVLQFSISVALIISSVVISRQLYFFRHMDTGLRRENIVMIPYQRNISHHYLAFKKSVENIKGIESVSTSAAPMYGGIDMTAAHYKDAMDNIFISEMYVDQQCLGLFGLAAYIAEQRTKEIGIRKVLGASVSQVWLLLSKDFIVLVLISCVIASPVAFYYMHDWLQQYDYRITITPVVFVIAGIAAIVITIITISFQAIKAAMANPVKSLRTE